MTNDRQTSNSDPSVAVRLEHCDAMRSRHFAQACARLHPESGAAYLELPGGGQATYSGPGMPNCRAKCLGLTAPVTAGAIDAAEAFFATHAAAPSFDICPLAHPSLAAALAERGYTLRKFFTVLAQPLPAPPLETAPEIEVRLARADEAELWAALTAAGFNDGLPIPPDSLAIMVINFHAANARPYLAFIDGQAVGGGGLYLDGDAAELGGTSVLPAFRRRGVQTALVQRRLADAAQQGVTLAMVLTRPGAESQRNLERLGFRVRYSKAVVGGRASAG